MKRLKMASLLLILLLLGAVIVAAHADGSDTLSLSGVADLAVLSEYPNLQTLTLTDCPAVDLTPVASCARLATLTIQWSGDFTGEGTYDLTPLAKCKSLRTLSLSGAGIADLSALAGMDKLTALAVENTAVADYSPIAKLNLKHLRLLGADADAVAAVFTAVGRKLESATVGNCALTDEANDAILSGTRLISLAFDGAEGIDGESARWAKLKNLASLTVTGGSVSSLEFLDSCVASVVVFMEDVRVGGARCSIDFDKYFIAMTDVPPEEMLRVVDGGGRHWLYAAVRLSQGTVPSDLIAAFADVPGLLSLDVQAVDPDAFFAKTWDGFDSLEQLKLIDCEDVQLQILSQLPGLRRLYVKNASVSGTAAVENLRRLQQLSLVGCAADDWAFLDHLDRTALTLLNLSACNGPDTLAFIADLDKLRILALENAPVTDLTPLTGLKLTDIYLYGCPIADYAPLQTLASLRVLYCNPDAVLPALGCRVERKSVIITD